MIWSEIEGWFSDLDAVFVRRICSSIKNGIIVEVGVFAGRSTGAMAPICMENNNTYYAIDNFRGNGYLSSCATKQQIDRDIKKLFKSNMEHMSLLEYVNLIHKDSQDAVDMFLDNEIDLCFIDADHSISAVKTDINIWWQKIKINGVLAGHDYKEPISTVIKNFVNKNGLKLNVGGRCWSIRKVL